MDLNSENYKLMDGVLSIKEGCKEIGSHEFYGFEMEKVIIPEGVTSIGYWAFGGCKNLKEVVLPSTLCHISKEAFALAEIETVTFSDGCPDLEDVSLTAVFGRDSLWINKQRAENEFLILGSKLMLHGMHYSTAIIPNGVTSIEGGAFDNDSISEVIIPESVKSIGYSSFLGCQELRFVNIKGNVESLGENAFRACCSLEVIEIPDSCAEIGAYAFSLCSSLHQFHMPKSCKTLEKELFLNCDSLESVDIHDKIKRIEDNAFSGCINLKNLNGIVPAMMNGCKISATTSEWLLENLWNDGQHLYEVVVLYLTQSGKKVMDLAMLMMLRDYEKTLQTIHFLEGEYKLKSAMQKKINSFIEENE